MPVTHSNVFSLLKDTIETVWGITYPKSEASMVWKKYMDEKSTDDAWVDDQEIVGPGLFAEKQQGAIMALDSVIEGVSVRYTMKTFALRLKIAEEVVEDNKYDKAVNWTTMLARSAAKTPDYDCANILNRAFNSSFVGGDGKELCATDHVLIRGGTYANELATPMSLSETALEAVVTALRTMPGSDGLIQGYNPKGLIIPPALEWKARRIVKSAQQNDTANNAINALKDAGLFNSDPIVVPYMSSATNWFVKTDAPNGLTWYWRRKPRFKKTNDEQAEVLDMTGSYRAARGWTDPRGLFGSAA
jgi:hypothetical protein